MYLFQRDRERSGLDLASKSLAVLALASRLSPINVGTLSRSSV